MLEGLWQDVRYGLATLARKPGVNAAVVLSLVLGIGANTAIFTLMDAIFLRPLPAVRDADDLVALYRIDLEEPASREDPRQWHRFSIPNYLDLREESRSFAGLATFQRFQVSLTGGEEAARVTALMASGNYFEVLGVRPAAGRFFTPAEDRAPGAHPVAVLSYGCWSRLFGADPGMVGRSVTVNGQPLTVVGVAPRGFKGTQVTVSVDVWVPLAMYMQVSPYPDFYDNRDASIIEPFGRLAEGVTPEQAEAELLGLTAELGERFPDVDSTQHHGVRLRPLVEGAVVPRERDRYMGYGRILVLAVLLILVIACINVAGLLFVRGMDRSREMAIRQSVGADQRRLVRQVLTETVLLFLIAGALSLPVAGWSLDLLWSLRPPDFAGSRGELGLDGPVLAFALGVTLLAGIASGLLPALRATRPNLVRHLAAAGEAPRRGRRWWRLRNLMVVLQVALATVALIGAGVFIRSLERAQGIELGFQRDGLIVATLAPGSQGYPEGRARDLYREILERVRALPGVAAAALSENRLLRGAVMQRQIYVNGQQEPTEFGGRTFNRTNTVAPGFFATVGIPVLKGRDFNGTDGAEDRLLAVVNQTMAEAAWPGEDPIGKRFRFDYPDQPPLEVVGVVADAKYRYLYESSQFFVYLPLSQNFVPSMTLHVRAEGDPAGVLSALRREIREIDPNLPLSDVGYMDGFIDEALWMERMQATALATFGALAVVMAMVGLYGVMRYAADRRRGEVAVRLALGARPAPTVRLILGEGAAVVIAGLFLGLALALPLFRWAISKELLHGMGAGELEAYLVLLSAYLLIAPTLLVVALVGSFLPALHAVRQDPMANLRPD